jgi:hypothetical protein
MQIKWLFIENLIFVIKIVLQYVVEHYIVEELMVTVPMFVYLAFYLMIYITSQNPVDHQVQMTNID